MNNQTQCNQIKPLDDGFEGFKNAILSQVASAINMPCLKSDKEVCDFCRFTEGGYCYASVE